MRPVNIGFKNDDITVGTTATFARFLTTNNKRIVCTFLKTMRQRGHLPNERNGEQKSNIDPQTLKR
jgi:hypothetical protein